MNTTKILQNVGVLAGLVGIVAGLFIFVTAPGTRQVGQQEMVSWGVGLVLVLQGLLLVQR